MTEPLDDILAAVRQTSIYIGIAGIRLGLAYEMDGFVRAAGALAIESAHGHTTRSVEAIRAGVLDLAATTMPSVSDAYPRRKIFAALSDALVATLPASAPAFRAILEDLA